MELDNNWSGPLPFDGIDGEQIESADVDGASPYFIFEHFRETCQIAIYGDESVIEVYEIGDQPLVEFGLRVDSETLWGSLKSLLDTTDWRLVLCLQEADEAILEAAKEVQSNTNL